MWTLLAIVFLLFLIPGILLWVSSPGKPAPFLDDSGKPLPGSIAEKTFVNIDGTRQGMFIKSKNAQNPVLLFLHGGPGMPTYFLTEKFPTGLEDHFTVCYWEQTGGGISANPSLSPADITVEKLISDAIEVTHYLRERFGQDKIYLMGHSWGSFLGIQTAAAAPELYHSYIGVAQMARQAESEKLAHRYMIEQYTKLGNAKMVQKLEQYDLSESENELISYFRSPVRDPAMHQLGIGTMRDMKSVISGIFLPVMQCRAYTAKEKINLWRAKLRLASETELIARVLSTDLTVQAPRLEIPVYFLCGKHDYTVNYDLSKDYLEQIEAPAKGFYTFEHSAHCPMHEEPGRFVKVMVEEVLKGG